MAAIPKVILLIETSTAFGRGLLRGIAKYSHLHGPWVFYREVGGMRKTLPQLRDWGANGMIVREVKKQEEMFAMGLPTIVCPHIRGRVPGVPNIVGDDDAIGTMAAEYLLHRGFKHFAFCGFDDMFWSRGRGENFGKRTAEAGFETHFYKQPRTKAKRLWQNEQAIIADWLKSLPKPAGLMACNDERGQHVTEACKLAGLHVPEEVAVLGVDNDESICDLSDPPISSIMFNSERAGYEAAELLDKMMRGQKVTKETIIIPALHIVTRQSTDIFALEDREVANALRFIRKHSKELIQVRDVLNVVSLSRYSLYQRFRRALGSSPNKEIRRARVDQVARLLVETNLSISEIASVLGYSSAAHIARYFREEKGMSLQKYRKLYGKR